VVLSNQTNNGGGFMDRGSQFIYPSKAVWQKLEYEYARTDKGEKVDYSALFESLDINIRTPM